MLTIYSDGGLKDNMAYGSFLVKGGKPHKFKFGDVTSNEAEYLTLIKALRYAIKRNKDKNIVILIDSQLVLKQIVGTWKCKNKKLRPLYLEAKKLIDRTHKDVVVAWIDNKKMKKVVGH